MNQNLMSVSTVCANFTGMCKIGFAEMLKLFVHPHIFTKLKVSQGWINNA